MVLEQINDDGGYGGGGYGGYYYEPTPSKYILDEEIQPIRRIEITPISEQIVPIAQSITTKESVIVPAPFLPDGTNSYIYNDTPFGNVKVYDLDAEIVPIERVKVAPEAKDLATAIPSNTPAIQATADSNIPASTIAPISTLKKPNYLVYGLGALVLALVSYKVLKKK